jgi:hypothetical protein
MKTHRESYPEQYNHPLCGKEVRIKTNGTVGTVERVVDSRFGKLAILKGNSVTAWLVDYCETLT